jgi:hypothetical protein
MTFRKLTALAIFALAGSADAAPQGESTYRGYFIIESEVEAFRPCNSKVPLWLDYTSEVRAPLYARYQELKARPYEEIYVVFRGVPGPPLDCAFCEEFKGSFKVVKAIEIRRGKVSDCE